MKLFLVLLAVIALGALWTVFRPRPAPQRRRAPRPAATPTPPRMLRGVDEPMKFPQPEARPIPAIAAILEAGAASELEAAEMPELLADLKLLTVEDLSESQRDELHGRLSTIPLPPRSAQQLMSPDFLAEAATRQFTDLVTREPLLSGKVIGRVNSAFYGLSSPIVSVSHAVTYLGLNAVRNMALQFTLEQAFSSDDPELQAFHARLFDAGTIAAELCSLLGPKIGVRDVGATSTQTVLSFLGDFAMPSLLPDGSAISNWPLGLLERTCNEQLALGVNAAIVGSLLMEEWGLPAAVSDDVRDINRVLVTPAGENMKPRDARLALSYACARIAESIALGRIRDPGQIELVGSPEPEYYHLQSYLKVPPLSRLQDMLHAPDARLALSRLVAASQRSRENPQAVLRRRR